MKFDSQVSGREVTQKLIDLGVKRTGLFTRLHAQEKSGSNASSVVLTCKWPSVIKHGENNLPAYTIGELYEMLFGVTSTADEVAEELIRSIEEGGVTVEEINDGAFK